MSVAQKTSRRRAGRRPVAGLRASHPKPERWDLLHVITRLELGGAQQATLYEVSNSHFGHGARHLAFGPGGILDVDAKRLSGVHRTEVSSLVREISPLRDLRAFVGVLRLVRRLRTAEPKRRLLVHTHSSKAGIVGRWAARLGGADLVVHSIHGFGHSHHRDRFVRPLLLLGERLTARITDGFTADSNANLVQGDRESILGSTPRKVVYCGIEIEAFSQPSRSRTEIRRELGLGRGVPVALNLSCLKPQKDPEAYVELARRVVAHHPKAVFLLAGDGELRSAVEAKIARGDLAGNVRLLGWRRDVADLLAASDLLVMTSRWEGLPQAFPQAMAAALPIVATRVDGAPEAITHGNNGLLYRVGDISGMARGVVKLMDDRGLRRRMGAHGRKQARRFSVETMMSELEAFYDELARSKGYAVWGRHLSVVADPQPSAK